MTYRVCWNAYNTGGDRAAGSRNHMCQWTLPATPQHCALPSRTASERALQAGPSGFDPGFASLVSSKVGKANWQSTKDGSRDSEVDIARSSDEPIAEFKDLFAPDKESYLILLDALFPDLHLFRRRSHLESSLNRVNRVDECLRHRSGKCAGEDVTHLCHFHLMCDHTISAVPHPMPPRRPTVAGTAATEQMKAQKASSCAEESSLLVACQLSRQDCDTLAFVD